MTIRIENTDNITNIELKFWNGGWNAGYDPDCFADLECNFAIDHPDRDDDGNIIASESDVLELIKWWQAECETVNNGGCGDVLDSLSDDETANGSEWHLIVE